MGCPNDRTPPVRPVAASGHPEISPSIAGQHRQGSFRGQRTHLRQKEQPQQPFVLWMGCCQGSHTVLGHSGTSDYQLPLRSRRSASRMTLADHAIELVYISKHDPGAEVGLTVSLSTASSRSTTPSPTLSPTPPWEMHTAGKSKPLVEPPGPTSFGQVTIVRSVPGTSRSVIIGFTTSRGSWAHA